MGKYNELFYVSGDFCHIVEQLWSCHSCVNVLARKTLLTSVRFVLFTNLFLVDRSICPRIMKYLNVSLYTVVLISLMAVYIYFDFCTLYNSLIYDYKTSF